MNFKASVISVFGLAALAFVPVVLAASKQFQQPDTTPTVATTNAQTSGPSTGGGDATYLSGQHAASIDPQAARASTTVVPPANQASTTTTPTATQTAATATPAASQPTAAVAPSTPANVVALLSPAAAPSVSSGPVTTTTTTTQTAAVTAAAASAVEAPVAPVSSQKPAEPVETAEGDPDRNLLGKPLTSVTSDHRLPTIGMPLPKPHPAAGGPAAAQGKTAAVTAVASSVNGNTGILAENEAPGPSPVAPTVKNADNAKQAVQPPVSGAAPPAMSPQDVPAQVVFSPESLPVPRAKPIIGDAHAAGVTSSTTDTTAAATGPQPLPVPVTMATGDAVKPKLKQQRTTDRVIRPDPAPVQEVTVEASSSTGGRYREWLVVQAEEPAPVVVASANLPNAPAPRPKIEPAKPEAKVGPAMAPIVVHAAEPDHPPQEVAKLEPTARDVPVTTSAEPEKIEQKQEAKPELGAHVLSLPQPRPRPVSEATDPKANDQKQATPAVQPSSPAHIIDASTDQPQSNGDVMVVRSASQVTSCVSHSSASFIFLNRENHCN